MSNRVKSLNATIHGRYSRQDAATVTSDVFWRIGFQFKKWIPAAIEARFQGKRFDPLLDAEVEGRYRTYIKYYDYVFGKLKKDDLTELDKYNMRKNLMELLILNLLFWSGLALMKAGEDDKELKKQTVYKFVAGQIDRLLGDLVVFVNPAEFGNATSSFALTKTFDDIYKFLLSLQHLGSTDRDAYLRSGKRKGEHKTAAAAKDVTAGVAGVTDDTR
jgi:hypothetical protein